VEDDFVRQCEGLGVKHMNTTTVGAQQQLTGVCRETVTSNHLQFTARHEHQPTHLFHFTNWNQTLYGQPYHTLKDRQ